MSKLRNNPSKEVPRRVLILTQVVTLFLFGASFVFAFNFLQVIIFLWLGMICNLICFWLIVKGSAMMIAKQDAGEAASLVPNMMLRYTIYGIMLFTALQFGTQAFIGGVMGILMVKVAITTDKMFI